MKPKYSFIILVCCLIQSSLLSGTNLDHFQKLDPSEYDISLLTIDRGPQFYALGGHSLFRIKEKKKNFPYDIAVNWGVFDFRAPHFLKNAIFGRLNYQAMAQSMGSILWLYKIEKRNIFENKLFLTPEQKKKLLAATAWWLKPENSVYRYNLFFKNCSTIVRDILKETLGENFKTYFTKQKKESFRKMGSTYFYQYEFTLLADLFITSTIDTPITAWEYFILPTDVPHLLKHLGRFNNQGQMEKEKLLGPTQKIYKGGDYSFLTYNFHSLIVLCFLSTLAGLSFFFAKRKKSFLKLRVLGISLILIGLLNTLFSLVMIFLWSFTEYTYTFHNANLWIFWPLDLIFVMIGIKIFFFNTPLKPKSVLARLGKNLLLIHLLGLLLQSSLWHLGFIQQDVSAFYLYLLAPYASFAWLTQKFILNRKDHLI